MEKTMHFCDFVEYRLEGVHRISKFNNFSSSQIAISRTDGSLELWLYVKKYEFWKLCTKIAGKKDYLIEFIFWSRDGNLFTCNTQGCIIKYNFNNLLLNSVLDLEFGAINAMDYCPIKNIAIACSGNNICLINIDSMIIDDILIRNIGHVVSLAFHPNGDKFIIGTEDSKVLVHSVDSKSSTSIDIKAVSAAQCVPWALLFLSDFTIVIGDSLGQVQFWDAYTSTCIQILKCHKKDIITLCVDTVNENFIISGSIDKTVNCITKKSDIRSNLPQNTYSYIKIYDSHHNDVYSVSIGPVNNTVLSGGYDGKICFYSFFERTFKRLSVFGISNNFSNYSVTDVPFNISYHTSDKVQIYKFDEKSLAYEILIEISNKTNFNIGTCSLSSDGKYLHFSTFDRLFLYQISYTGENSKDISIKKIKELNFGCMYAKFSYDCKYLFIICYDGQAKIYDIENKNIIFSASLPADNAFQRKWDIEFYQDKFLLFLYSKPFTVYIVDILNQSLIEFCNIYRPIFSAFINQNLQAIVGISLNGRIINVKMQDEPEIFEHKIKIYSHNIHGFINTFHDKLTNTIYLQTIDHITCYYSNEKPLDEINNFTYNKMKSIYRNSKNWFIYSASHSDGSIIVITKKPTDIYSSVQPPVFIKKFKAY